MRGTDGCQQALQVFGLVAQTGQVQLRLGRVEHPDHQFFPKQGGQSAHTQVQLPPWGQLQFHAPVLWQAFFRDV